MSWPRWLGIRWLVIHPNTNCGQSPCRITASSSLPQDFCKFIGEEDTQQTFTVKLLSIEKNVLGILPVCLEFPSSIHASQSIPRCSLASHTVSWQLPYTPRTPTIKHTHTYKQAQKFYETLAYHTCTWKMRSNPKYIINTILIKIMRTFLKQTVHAFYACHALMHSFMHRICHFLSQFMRVQNYNSFETNNDNLLWKLLFCILLVFRIKYEKIKILQKALERSLKT